MLRAISVVLQAILFLVVNVLVLFIPHASHIQTRLGMGPNGMRTFIWDGMLAMLFLYFLVLLIEAAVKRAMRWSGMTTIAFVLAIAAALLLKLGFTTT